MAEVLRCKDVGVDCAFGVHGKTIDDVLKRAAHMPGKSMA